MSSRKYLVGMLVLALLIWGPIDHSWPAWFLIRMGYLIAIAIAAWFLLGWIWRVWQPDAASEARMERALGGVIVGIFLVMAILATRATRHVGNTMWIGTRDGMEAIGDDIILPGPDWANVAILTVFAGFAFWFSIAKRKRNS